MDKVLITGATGFVGSHVAGTLKSMGLAVRCLARAASRLDHLDPASMEIVRGDVMRPETLPPALERVDGVVHCAGITRAFRADDYYRVNQEGSRNLYQACRGRRLKIVHISSLAALGPSAAGQPVDEGVIPHPVSDYGRSKLAGQQAAESFMPELPITILIPPAVYGPGDEDFRFYFRLAAAGISPLPGGAPRYLSLIYVKDLARAVALALSCDQAAGRTYLVDDGCIRTWAAVAEAVEQARGKTSRRIYLPPPAARLAGRLGDWYGRISGRAVLLNSQKIEEFLQPAWTSTAARIRDELGFRPAYSLELGFRETLAWVRQQTTGAFP